MSVLYGTERLPQPYEAIGVVSVDVASRTLTVKLSDTCERLYEAVVAGGLPGVATLGRERYADQPSDCVG